MLGKLVHKIRPLHIFILFLFLHLVFLNVNAAEWGDSYRILRASEYLRNELSYPVDEKRPPLYSLLLAFYPSGVDQVLWGRLMMLAVSLAAFKVFYELLKLYFPAEPKKVMLGLWLFTLNPVYLYWSLRLMADVFFSFLVMFTFLLYEKYRDDLSNYKVSVLGILTALSILTRFEGYILFGAIILGIIFPKRFSIKGIKFFTNDLLERLTKNAVKLVVYTISTTVVIAPYFINRNPFTSSYFEEPAGRTYDLNTLAIFLISVTFIFGMVQAIYFIFYNRKRLQGFFLEHPALTSFIIVDLLLILAWPAAVPRLFVPIIPFGIAVLSNSIIDYFNGQKSRPIYFESVKSIFIAGIPFLLPAVYLTAQLVYRLQFLVLIKPAFLGVLGLSVVQIIFIYKKQLMEFMAVATLILLIWCFSTIYIHKDIFRVIKEANLFLVENHRGKVGHNDISSVTDWYLNHKDREDNIEGFFYDLTKKQNREPEKLLESGADYFMVTNEHNTDTELDLTSWPHLEVIKDFRYEINSKVFWTRIIKFNK